MDTSASLDMSCRELFEWIELEPKRYWHSLLFMDQVRIIWSYMAS